MMMDTDAGMAVQSTIPSKSVLWEEIQSGILAGIGAADTTDTLENAVQPLYDLNDSQLCCFVCSKEGITMMKSNVVVENDALRSVFICTFGALVIRAWTCLHADIELEGFTSTESRAEARRLREDFIDMAIDLFKNFAFGCIGKATGADAGQLIPDNYLSMNTYCEVVAILIASYNDSENHLDGWTDALLGVSGSGSRYIATKTRLMVRQRRRSLVPLLRPVLNIVFGDPHLLVTRCKACGLYSGGGAAVVSGFAQLLLSELGPGGSPFALLDLSSTQNYQPMFAAGRKADSTLESTSGDAPLPVVQFASEWAGNYLLYAVAEGAEDPAEIASAAREVIVLCQHRLMVDCREKSVVVLLERLLYLLETDFSARYEGSVAPLSRSDLICHALLTQRYLPPPPPPLLAPPGEEAPSGNNYTPELTEWAVRLLRVVLSQVGDEVSQTRLLAELAGQLVHASTNVRVELEFGSVAAEVEAATARYDFSKTSLGQILLRTQERGSSLRHPRFIGAILRALHSAVDQTVEALMSQRSAEAAIDGTADLLDSSDDATQQADGSSHGTETHSWALFQRERITFVSHSASADGLCEVLARQLQAVLFVVRVCGDSYLRWPVSGSAGDLVPVCFVELVEAAAAILLPVQSTTSNGSSENSSTEEELSSSGRVGALVHEYLIRHEYQQTVRTLAHALSVAVDRQVESLIGNSGARSFVDLVSCPHMMRYAELCVRFLQPMAAVTGSKDLAQSLFSYLRALLKQSSSKRKHFLAALQARANEGLLGGGRGFNRSSNSSSHPSDSRPDQDPLTMHHRMHALSLLVHLAANAPDTLPSCVALGREVEQHLYVSSATLTAPEHQGIISGAAPLREHVERIIRCLTSLQKLSSATGDNNDGPVSSSEAVKEALSGAAEDQAHRLDFSKLLSLNAALLYEDDTHAGHRQQSNGMTEATSGSDLFGGVPAVAAASGGGLNGLNGLNGVSPQGADKHKAGGAPSLMDLLAPAPLPTSTGRSSGTASDVAASHVASSAQHRRLLPEPLLLLPSHDLTDHSREYGLFDGVAARRRDPTHYASSADVLALVDDVLVGHCGETSLSGDCANGLTGAERTVAPDWSAVLSSSWGPSSTDAASYTQVSGSCDVLTVLAATQVDAIAGTVAVRVKVCNGSGFKIPIFSLHVMLRSNGTATVSTGSSSGSSINDAMTSVYDSAALYRATGCEYFLSDATVERTFVFAVTALGGPVGATVRVVYPDLNLDDDDGEEGEDLFAVPIDAQGGGGASGGGRKASSRAQRNAFSSALSGSYFDGYALTDSGYSSGKNTAIINCAALRVPVSAFLLPYGGGALSSMRYFLRSAGGGSDSELGTCESVCGGIPEAVFTALWARLAGAAHGELIVPVRGVVPTGCTGLCLPEMVAANITESVAAALRISGGNNLYLLGADGRVDASRGVAWSHQTWWGAEVACQLTVDGPRRDQSAVVESNSPLKSTDVIGSAFSAGGGRAVGDAKSGGYQRWNGALVVRSGDVATLSAVHSDLSSYLFSIGCGCVDMCAP